MIGQASGVRNAALILDMLAAIETRDLDAVRAFYGLDISFEWQPGLPYAGAFEREAIQAMSEMFCPDLGHAPDRSRNPRAQSSDHCQRGGG